jgi:hypothetical protein
MKNILSVLAIAAFSGTAASQGFIPASPNCAILYGNENFQQNEFPDPGVYVLKDDERHAKLESETWGNFQNRTSAATVRSGCKLTLYASRNFGGLPLQVIEGPKAVTSKNGSLLHNDAASSAVCECPNVWSPPPGAHIHPPIIRPF